MQIVIDIDEDTYKYMQSRCKYQNKSDKGLSKFEEAGVAIKNGTPLPKGHERKFEEIMVGYPPAELCTYPEYRDKPYFSIKYEEDGRHIIGFGTYKPEVLSRYLREYFIAPTIIEAESEE